MSENVRHEDKVTWMALWAARNGVALALEATCGIGRECVGILVDSHFPDYEWRDKEWNRADPNGEVWVPQDAYHKHPCVAVLGRGEEAEAQLYDWLRWFDKNGFKVETGDQPVGHALSAIGLFLGKHRYARMVRQAVTP